MFAQRGLPKCGRMGKRGVFGVGGRSISGPKKGRRFGFSNFWRQTLKRPFPCKGGKDIQRGLGPMRTSTEKKRGTIEFKIITALQRKSIFPEGHFAKKKTRVMFWVFWTWVMWAKRFAGRSRIMEVKFGELVGEETRAR